MFSLCTVVSNPPAAGGFNTRQRLIAFLLVRTITMTSQYGRRKELRLGDVFWSIADFAPLFFQLIPTLEFTRQAVLMKLAPFCNMLSKQLLMEPLASNQPSFTVQISWWILTLYLEVVKGWNGATFWGRLIKHPLLHPPSQAPARTLAEKTRAFADQHGKAFAKSSLSSFGVNVKNAAWT